eukprot:6156951-Prymnesium_polylepis.1
MAEMTLIKLGEIVDKPQAKRVKMVERAAEEQRAAAEARKRAAEATAKDAATRSRHAEMNKQAYDAVAPVWRRVAAARSLEGSSDAVRALAKRLQNRAELQLVLLEPAAARTLPPARFQAMGTSGLQPVEMRAV